MITDLLLATTLGLGQMPIPYAPTPVAAAPAQPGMVLVMQPGATPMTTPMPMTMPMNGMKIELSASCCVSSRHCC